MLTRFAVFAFIAAGGGAACVACSDASHAPQPSFAHIADYSDCTVIAQSFDRPFLYDDNTPSAGNTLSIETDDALGPGLIEVTYGLAASGAFTSFEFLQASHSAAHLYEAAPNGAAGICGTPSGTSADFASFDATSGTLTYGEGAAILALTGTLSADSGSCAAGATTSPVTLTVMCQNGGPSTPDAGAAPQSSGSPPAITPGTYSCQETVYSNAPFGDAGAALNTTSGSVGTLTVTSNATQIAAQYTDLLLQTSLTFDFLGADSASLPPGQTASVACVDPTSGNVGETLAPMNISSGALTIDGSSVLLSLLGDVSASSTCAASTDRATLVCTAQP